MPDVIVVGAGFAGLSAAAALVEAGADVLVVEARPGLGGRASSFRDPETGEIVDNGQHVLAGCYHETRRFLARIGASDGLEQQTTLRVPLVDRDGTPTVLTLPPLPSPLHVLGGVLAWRALSVADRLSLLRLAPALKESMQAGLKTRLYKTDPPSRRGGSPHPPDDTDFHSRRGGSSAFARSASADRRSLGGGWLDPPDETVRAWLVRHGQSPRLCELLWEPLALAALNQSIDEAAAPHFAGVLVRMFGPDPDDAALVVPTRPLSALYAEPARMWIEARGGRVRVNAPARVVVQAGMVHGVRVRGELIPSRAVIAAVPWYALPDLFETPVAALDDVVRAAANTPASPIVTVNLWLDRAVLDESLVGLPGRTFQWVFDRRAIVGDDASHLSLVSSGAAAIVDRSNEELIAIALQELRAAVPAARAAVLRKASAVRERRATFSLAPGLPSRPDTETAVPGLLLAGDWIATGLPATIESAVVSGHRAALHIHP